jgi:DnaK suppressor protein
LAGAVVATMARLDGVEFADGAEPGHDQVDDHVRDEVRDQVRDEVRARIHTEQHRLQLLVDSLDKSFADLTEAADASPPDDEHDPEGHTIAFERSQLTSRRDGFLRSIAELEAAAARLDDPESALCLGCAEPIPHERRLAMPSTTRCIDCARSVVAASSPLHRSVERPPSN